MKYVLVTADKALNNIVVVCTRKFVDFSYSKKAIRPIAIKFYYCFCNSIEILNETFQIINFVQ